MRTVILLLVCALAPLAAQTDTARNIEFGFEQRVRNENFNNLFDFSGSADDQRVQVRWRTRAWMKAPLSRDIDFTVGVNQETNQILTPDRPFRFDEAFFETAYVDFKRLFVHGLSLRVGRQDLRKGEGFLLFDGTPGDGSRTLYFNAAVLGYSWKKSKIELIGISNPRTDRYLPRVHDRSKALIDWNERALGAYYTGSELKDTAIEAYYFYKKETGDPRPVANVQHQGDRHLWTAGGRAIRKFPHGLSLTSEFASQWGEQHPNRTLASKGGYAYLKKNFGRDGRHYVLGGYIGLSGDDPATPSKIENWDPLFSRWPKWSELLIYTQLREIAGNYWSNTGMWQAEMVYVPLKPVNVRLTYYHLAAFHPFSGAPSLYATGKTRGDLPQIRVDYTPNKYWKFHALYERMVPGNFYSARAPAYFLRFEAIFTYKASVKAGEL